MSRVFIEFSVGENTDRLEIQLFDHRCPKAIANFLYLLNAHEIPDDVIAARQKAINSPLPSPLKATRILRIQPGKLIDFGVSGTDSVYGGCYDDEAVGPTEQQQANLKTPAHPNFLHDFGTISVANCGANLNGSKYFISLDRRPDIDGYHQIIGVVAPHSQQALRNLASCKVNIKKGFVPEPAVKICDCGIIRANEAWKQIALGTNVQQQQASQPSTTTTTTTSRLKLLKGRGSQLEKRMAQGDAETLMNQEDESNNNNTNNTNNNSNKNSTATTSFEAALEAAEIARRRAKRRRIEDAAVGSGAWVEPPEVASGTATRGGVVANNNNNSSNNNNNNIKFGADYVPRTGGVGLSFSQAYQAAGGNMEEAQRLVDESKQKQLSERNMFAVAARTNQFLQDVNILGAQQKSKHLKQQRGNSKKKSLKY